MLWPLGRDLKYTSRMREEGTSVVLWKYHISSWEVYPDGAASDDFWHMAATSVCQVLVLCSCAPLKWLIWLVAAWKLCTHTRKNCVAWPSFTLRWVREDVSAPCQMLLTEMSKQHSQVVWWLSLQGLINWRLLRVRKEGCSAVCTVRESWLQSQGYTGLYIYIVWLPCAWWQLSSGPVGCFLQNWHSLIPLWIGYIGQKC